MYTGYVITGIKKDGCRHMALNNDGSNTHKTESEALQQLSDILNNPYNDPITIEQCLGNNLRVDPVTCYDHGDATRTVF